MDTRFPKTKFPLVIAREKAGTLERYTRLRQYRAPTRTWRSWSAVAAYSAKRMGLLQQRSGQSAQEKLPAWFIAVRENVTRIGQIAYNNPWKRTIDISIRRFREWLETPYENQLWMAVALIETSRLSKQTGRQKPILPGWNACFTRNRFRINYESSPTTQHTPWELCALRNTKLRFARNRASSERGLLWQKTETSAGATNRPAAIFRSSF